MDCKELSHCSEDHLNAALQEAIELSKQAWCRDAIVNWVKKRLVGVESLSSLDELRKAKERSEVFLVGYFDKDEVRLSTQSM